MEQVRPWSQRLELTYRGYVRMASSVDDALESVLKELGNVSLGCVALDPHCKIEVSESTSIYLPVAEEKLEQARRDGNLILKEDVYSLAVRQWVITVHFPKEDEP